MLSRGTDLSDLTRRVVRCGHASDIAVDPISKGTLAQGLGPLELARSNVVVGYIGILH
jgi:hypothetical protein